MDTRHRHQTSMTELVGARVRLVTLALRLDKLVIL